MEVRASWCAAPLDILRRSSMFLESVFVNFDRADDKWDGCAAPGSPRTRLTAQSKQDRAMRAAHCHRTCAPGTRTSLADVSLYGRVSRQKPHFLTPSCSTRGGYDHKDKKIRQTLDVRPTVVCTVLNSH
ncbi:unnamed protein product, partial [Scytosiphon promiscuus]